MKRKSAWLSFTACALTAASAPAPARATAQPVAAPMPNFCEVQAVNCPGGHTGFFEAKTGTLYIYDTAQGRCVGVRKLTRLGEDMESVNKLTRGR